MPKGGIRALVIDPEAAMRRYLRASLAKQGYTVSEANSGQDALSAISAREPDVVLLDPDLPDLDGIQLTRLLRQLTQVPILVVSTSNLERSKIAALDAGADDYVTKPFGLGELLARIRAALRRAGGPYAQPVFSVDGLTVAQEGRTVYVAGREVPLTPTEYALLWLLVSHAGKVLTHRQLLRSVWGSGHEQKLHMLRVNISNLRNKIEPNATHRHYIRTVPGVGYRLETEPDPG